MKKPAILGTSISDLLRGIGKKEYSGAELHSYFRTRIESYNKKLNAYLAVPEVPSKISQKGMLAGIPLAVKDNFCTKGIATTASATVLEGFIPPYDSTVTAKLKNAGATLLGKTNMDAWAHGSSTETSDFGPTRNPWDTDRAPGGSSGGSAAAVSAYLAPAAIGSETAGSIRQPASWCGTVGLKPTYGRVSRYGVIAMGSSFDCPGPITLNIEDAALILEVIAGKDSYDATSSPHPVEPYRQRMKDGKKYTIGVADEYMEGIDEGVRKRIDESISLLTKMGHTVKKVKLIPPKYAISVYTIVQRAEVSSNLARYDGIRYGNDRTAFGAEAKRRIMLGAYTLSYGYYDAFYKKAQKVRTLIIEDFKRAFKDVDLILSPTTPITALKLGEFEKYPFFGEMMDVLNEPAAVAGIPALNVPCGFDSNGLPVGMQLMANYFNESALLDLGYQYENETHYFGVIQKGLERYKD